MDQEVGRLGGQMPDPTDDDVADSLRQRKVQGPAGCHLVEPPFGGQQPDRLAEEERVAAGLAHDRVQEVRAWCHPRSRLDQLAHRRLAEAHEAQAQRVGLTSDLPHRGGHRRIGDQLHLAIRADDHDRRVAELARHETQVENRRHVRGVQVVDDDQQRARLRRATQERGGRVEQLESRGLRLDLARRRQVAERLAKLNHHLGDICGPGPQLVTQHRVIGRADDRSKDLHPWPVGRGSGALQALTVEDSDPFVARADGQLIGQTASCRFRARPRSGPRGRAPGSSRRTRGAADRAQPRGPRMASQLAVAVGSVRSVMAVLMSRPSSNADRAPDPHRHARRRIAPTGQASAHRSERARR